MKKILSFIMLLVMIFSSLTVLTSCGKPKDDGAEINIYLGSQVFDFDPSDYYVSDNAERILSLIYEPLFTLKENGKVKPAAAKKYEVDKEERKIVITIRESYWSDNTQVTANDFVYAWCERIINPANPNPAAALFLGIEGVKEAMNGECSISDVAIKATEMDQLTITYCEGADYKQILANLASIATAPVRQSSVESAETYWSKYSVVTNGAFKLKSYKKEYVEETDEEYGTFELMRNLGYHQSPDVKDYDNKVRPGLLYGEFTLHGKDVSVSYEDITNRVTFIMADASLAEKYENKKEAEVADHTSVYTYVFNTSKPLFADVNVRLALSSALDRNAIIEAIKNDGKLANGFVPDVSGGAEEDLIVYGVSPERAQKYLDAADKDVVRENRSFTLTIDSDERSAIIADIAKKAWEGLGFTVEVVVAEPVESTLPDGSTIVDSGIQYLIKDASYGVSDYDVVAVDWQTYTLDPIPALASLTSNINGMGKNEQSGDPSIGQADTSEARKNIAGWSDAKYDKLVADAIACDNKKDREKKLAEAEKYLLSQMPVCPLIFNQSVVFVSSKISKFEFDVFGNMNLTNVKLGKYKKYLKNEENEQ